MSLLNERIKLAASNFDNRKFRGDEERVEEDERKQGQQPENDNLTGFPMCGGERLNFPCRHSQHGSDKRHGCDQLTGQKLSATMQEGCVESRTKLGAKFMTSLFSEK
jgi:hypothetical protein